MNTLLLVVHGFTCVVLVLVVLVQAGKDGGIGAMSGGSSQTVFGSSGGANFFTKFTSVTAAIFMMTSIALTITKSGKKRSIFEDMRPAAATSTTIPETTTTAPTGTTQAPAAKAAPAPSAPAKKN